ncbi:MAG: arginine repressor [Ruminococcus sp.]|nr:arginine repressor [Ruminococcus sp.]
MKTRRQAAILDLINEYSIETQEELLTRLKEKGYNVTQATVSRDIKELRLLKTLSNDGKYRYTSYTKNSTETSGGFNGFINSSVVSVKPAQNIVVIKTLAGMANAICASIDTIDFKGIVGTLAGDDTIFIVCADNERASNFVFEIQKYL